MSLNAATEAERLSVALMEEWTVRPVESMSQPLPVCDLCAIQGAGPQSAQSGLLRKRSELTLCPHLTSLCTAQRMAAIVAHY